MLDCQQSTLMNPMATALSCMQPTLRRMAGDRQQPAVGVPRHRERKAAGTGLRRIEMGVETPVARPGDAAGQALRDWVWLRMSRFSAASRM